MTRRATALLLLALSLPCAPASAAFNSFDAFTPPATNAPVVNTAALNTVSPASTSQAVGTATALCGGVACSGGNAITGWSITAGNTNSDLAIDNSGNITVTAQGAIDLNGAANEAPFTLTVTATNGAGTSPGQTVSIVAYADGFVGASTGSPILPAILNSYGTTGARNKAIDPVSGKQQQPPWNVACVDYECGVPASATLADPSTLTGITGITVNAAGHTVTVGSSFVANPLTNIDFSLDGGWELNFECNNCTLTNSKFAIGSNGLPLFNGNAGGTNKTVAHSTFNGNGTTDALNQTNLFISGGTSVFDYDIFENSCSDAVDLAGSGSQSYQGRYNLILNTGRCSSAHADQLQQGGATYSNNVLDFNTLVQTTLGAAGGTQGIGMDTGNNSAIVAGASSISNNTLISLAGVSQNYQISALPTTGATITINHNFMDPTGSAAVYKNFGAAGNSYTNNVNMKTGASQNTN